MRRIAIKAGEPIKRISQENRYRLKDWLLSTHLSAKNSRAGTERVWQKCLRNYQGQPPDKYWVPFEGAPYVEITVGAKDTDAVYAQALDLIFQTKPPVTVRSRKAEYDEHADAMQDLINWGVNSGTWRWSAAVKECLLDDVQLGTMIGYAPWTQTIRKTDLKEITDFGPVCYSIAPEDFILPAQATKDIQTCRFVTMQMVMSKQELNLNARINNWTLDDVNTSSDTRSSVRSDRLRSEGMSSGSLDPKKDFKIGDTFCYFDIDGDGIDEDLEVIWNMDTGGLYKVMYNRFDCRPFVLECYQDRAHVVYGMGVMEADEQFETAITQLFNNDIWNLMISNTKMYSLPPRLAVESPEIYPGKAWDLDAGEKIESIDMGVVNSSGPQRIAMLMEFARERVGVQSLSAPARLGGRTPGITALSAMQAANRRFTAPFDNMRNFCAQMILQCVYRIQEQIRDPKTSERVRAWLDENLGPDKAQLLVELFTKSSIEISDAVDIELTASSVSVNRESDRQNAVMLIQTYNVYAQGMAQLAAIIGQPPVPGADIVARETAKAVNKLMEKFLRTFDQVSDVQGFLIDIEPVAQAQEQIQAQIQQFAQQMGQPQGQGQPPMGGPNMPPNGVPPGGMMQ